MNCPKCHEAFPTATHECEPYRVAQMDLMARQLAEIVRLRDLQVLPGYIAIPNDSVKQVLRAVEVMGIYTRGKWRQDILGDEQNTAPGRTPGNLKRSI